MMVYIHEKNINGKLKSDFKNLKQELTEFYTLVYQPFRNEIDQLTFDEEHRSHFNKAAELIWNYYCDVRDFASKHSITSQSKFTSSFLEEMSTYFFAKLPQIKNGSFSIYNDVQVYSGLKIDNELKISVIPKKVDFCIGRETAIKIGSSKEKTIIFPIIAVEVKTYLDATMFGEVQFTSSKLRAAAPYVKAYVLMMYKNVDDEHIIAARANSPIDEMFVLKKEKILKGKLPKKSDKDKISGEALYQYWKKISSEVSSALANTKITTPGRLFEQ